MSGNRDMSVVVGYAQGKQMLKFVFPQEEMMRRDASYKMAIALESILGQSTIWWAFSNRDMDRATALP